MPHPSNILGWTEPRIITRLDYFGQPYEYKTIMPLQPDRGELWRRFKQMQTEQPAHIGRGHQPVSDSWGKREADKILNEKG